MVLNINKPSPSSIYLTKPKKKLPVKLSFALMILLIIILSGFIGGCIVYKFLYKSQDQPFLNQSFGSDNTSTISNAFASQAQKVGAKKCEAVFSVLGDSAVNGSNHDMMYFGSEASADQNPIGALIGQFYAGNNARGSAVVFASPLNNGCAGVLMRTVLQLQPCSKVAQLLPEGSEQLKNLTATAVFHLPNNFNVMLMPASETSCIIVSSLNLIDKK